MLKTPPLVDARCHGVLTGDLGLGTFETHLAGPGARPAPGTTLFDSRTGFAVRRWCPPLLGLEPHCPPARYLAVRRALGAYESTRRLLRGAGVGACGVDTGTPPGLAPGGERDLTPPGELGAAMEAHAWEIACLELLARRAAAAVRGVDAFLAVVVEAVHRAADTVRGFSAVFRVSPDGPAAGPPPAHEVRRAAEAWLAVPPTQAGPPGPALRDHLLWNALATGLPLQLRQSSNGDPAAMERFLRATAGLGTDVVLLPDAHGPRGAARLAAAYRHVYTTVGPGDDLDEVLDLAPFGKVLYASRAAVLPELYVVGARQLRESLERMVTRRVADGAWSLPDALRVAGMVAGGNTRRLYRLPDTASGRPRGSRGPVGGPAA